MELVKFMFSGLFTFIGFMIILNAILWFMFLCWNRFLRSRNIAKHGWPPIHLDADGDSITADALELPFEPGDRVKCIRDSIQKSHTGRNVNGIICIQGKEYTVDGCVWSYIGGWLVSISGELHNAKDFEDVLDG